MVVLIICPYPEASGSDSVRASRRADGLEWLEFETVIVSLVAATGLEQCASTVLEPVGPSYEKPLDDDVPMSEHIVHNIEKYNDDEGENFMLEHDMERRTLDLIRRDDEDERAND
ncbi:hypothetical protein HAX54_039319 [Datura stramonium]|uniref:Uncharacterized protein n=1 Tax=Datura stramonium TaxID=4076 RepID=A0ABS8VMW1_DATST|nr:hypothetical protein [Datura stramonium]